MNAIEILTELTTLSAPSCREWNVQRYIADKWGHLFSYVQGDAMGNLIAHTHPEARKKVAIVAHADEIGVQITDICPPGIARFRKIGGLRATSLIGQRLVFHTADNSIVEGIVGCDPMQNNGTENGIIVKTSDLWIDIGAESEDEFKSRLAIGAFGSFAPSPMINLGQHRFSSKSVDDRIGLTIAISVIESMASSVEYDLMLISTVQEELNLYGAKSLTEKVDMAIVIDVDFASDTPSDLPEGNNLHLGKGIGLCVNADNSPILMNNMREICDKQRIPYQLTIGRSFSGGTDAAAIRLTGAVPCINVNIPLRYMHTANELFDVRDLEYAIQSIKAFLQNISLCNNDSLCPWK